MLPDNVQIIDELTDAPIVLAEGEYLTEERLDRTNWHSARRETCAPCHPSTLADASAEEDLWAVVDDDAVRLIPVRLEPAPGVVDDLRDEAQRAGDVEMVALCDAADDGDVHAVAAVVTALIEGA